MRKPSSLRIGEGRRRWYPAWPGLLGKSDLIQRFHRTLKEEEVYWRFYENPADARACLAEFEAKCNERRPHWALVPEGGGDRLTPQEVYIGKVRPQLPRWQAWAREAKVKLNALRERPAA